MPETRLKELMQRREPLHPILRLHIHPDGPFGAMIKHPLIQEIMYVEHLNAIINERFRLKTIALTEALEARNWGKVIALHERPWRINVLLEHRHAMTHQEYWECVGEVWTDSENLWQTYEQWRDLWETPRTHKRHAMLDSERRKFGELPEEFKVFRGIHGRGVTKQRHRIGMSWTTDPEVAKKFATMHKQEPQKILYGIVKKSDVHAYFTRRNEFEIVSTLVKVQKFAYR